MQAVIASTTLVTLNPRYPVVVGIIDWVDTVSQQIQAFHILHILNLVCMLF